MKHIILSNNFEAFKKSEYYKDKETVVYTDSIHFYIKYPKAIHLDKFLDDNFEKQIDIWVEKIKKTNGYIYDIYFPDLKDELFIKRDINLLPFNIAIFYLKIAYKYQALINNLEKEYEDYKLILLIDECEVPEFEELDFRRFSNLFYMFFKFDKRDIIISKCNKKPLIPYKLPNIFTRIKNKHPFIVIFSFLKKILPRHKKVVGLYKDNETIQEIEPYLYLKGYSLKKIEEFKSDIKVQSIESEKIYNLIKELWCHSYEKIIIYRLVINLIKKYLSDYEFFMNFDFDNLPKIIITNSLTQKNLMFFYFYSKIGKFIVITHAIGNGYAKKCNVLENEAFSLDIKISNFTFAKNVADEKCFNSFLSNIPTKTIFTPYEVKSKIFFKKSVDKIMYISPFLYYHKVYSSKKDFDLFKYEKSILSILGIVKKKVIYKPYPSSFLVDNLDKIRNDIEYIYSIDFRYLRNYASIFIITKFIASSTFSWVFGTDKPCIYLYNKNIEILDDKIIEILKKSIFVIEVKNNWEEELKELLNKPFEEIYRLWQKKEIYREQYDEYLIGREYIAGKLGAEYIDKLYKGEMKWQ